MLHHAAEKETVLILQFLLHLLHLMFLLGEREQERVKQTTVLICCGFIGGRGMHASFPQICSSP